MFERLKDRLLARKIRRVAATFPNKIERERATQRARAGMYASLEVDEREQALAYATAWAKLARGTDDYARAKSWRRRLASGARVGVKTFPILALRVRKDDPTLATILEVEEALRGVEREEEDR